MQQIFEVTPRSFQTDVVDRSANMPVLLLFWAEQMPAAADAKRQLEGLVGGYGDKLALGLVDTTQDPTLAQHLQVQALPSLRVISQGQIVHQSDGPQPESALRALLDQLTQSPAEAIKAQLSQHLEQDDLRGAERLLRQGLREEPTNPSLRVELADVLARRGEIKDARKMLGTVPEDAAERDRPQTRLELAHEAADLPSPASLKAKLKQDPDDLEAHCQLAVVEAANGDVEAALERALHVLQKDRSFGDDLGRRTMLRIFIVLGKGNELANSYRRKMFNFMH